MGRKSAAEPAGSLQQRETNLPARLAGVLLEKEGGGQTGDAPSGDHDPQAARAGARAQESASTILSARPSTKRGWFPTVLASENRSPAALAASRASTPRS